MFRFTPGKLLSAWQVAGLNVDGWMSVASIRTFVAHVDKLNAGEFLTNLALSHGKSMTPLTDEPNFLCSKCFRV